MTKLNDILGNTTTTLNTWQLFFSAFISVGQSWSEFGVSRQSEERDTGILQSQHGREEKILAVSWRSRRIWTSLCCI